MNDFWTDQHDQFCLVAGVFFAIEQKADAGQFRQPRNPGSSSILLVQYKASDGQYLPLSEIDGCRHRSGVYTENTIHGIVLIQCAELWRHFQANSIFINNCRCEGELCAEATKISGRGLGTSDTNDRWDRELTAALR